jgi:hypothetical protein
MLSKVLVLSCVCALALTACKKKEANKSSEDTGMATAAMDPAKDDGMRIDAMKDDAMRAAPMGQFDAKAGAEQVLQMQADLTKVMVAAMPDCDKVAAAAMALLDEPKWKKVVEMVKANKDAVRAAQSTLIKTDRSKSAFMRGRMQVMIKCKANKKHAALAKRLGAMWK